MLPLILTHGRDNPFGNPIEMGQAFENNLRYGLQRVQAPYAATIPMTFAFYGDLWRPDTRAAGLVPGAKGLTIAAPDNPLAVAIAEEILTAANALPTGSKGFWADLRGLIGAAEKYVPGRVSGPLLTRLAGDVAEYLSNPPLRDQTIDRLLTPIQRVGGAVVLLAHSMGTIVAYDLLTRHPDLPVQAFISFGSPLGMRVIRDRLGAGPDTLRFPPRLPRWINLSGPDDFVAAVRYLAPLYPASDGRMVEDVDTGPGKPTRIRGILDGHDPEVYLSSLAMGWAVDALVTDHKS